jgi:hypothetical protein
MIHGLIPKGVTEPSHMTYAGSLQTSTLKRSILPLFSASPLKARLSSHSDVRNCARLRQNARMAELGFYGLNNIVV